MAQFDLNIIIKSHLLRAPLTDMSARERCDFNQIKYEVSTEIN